MPAGTTDLLGKKASELQTNVKISGNNITGTLNYVTGYTQFNQSVTDEQKGNFLALKFESEGADSITCEYKGNTTKGPVKLDADGLMVIRVTDKTKSVVVVAKKGSDSKTETYNLNGLTLTAAKK